MSFPFNVRVYGALVIGGKILLSDETYRGKSFTKLPGGGLEFGEGPKDCIRREIREETGLEVEVSAHIYTTGFFQESAFDSSHQVISIYYQVIAESLDQPRPIPALEQGQKFKWIELTELGEDHFTFQIDKYVVPYLRNLMQ